MLALAAILGGAAVLLAVAALASFLVSRGHAGDGRRARIRHAWREAGHRAGGAWLDFGDWLRAGR